MKFNKITISGKICTGKTTLLKSLQKKLNWPTFQTGQLFRDYVKAHKLNLEMADEQNEKLTKEIDYKVRDMLHENSRLIVDGWMSGLSASGVKDALKVFLICKDDIRYKRFAKRESIAVKEAGVRVEERQESWFSKMKKIHKIDPTEFVNKKNYDLIIDTSYITPQAVLKQVIKSL